MTDPKNETIWITIPDETTSASTDGPALKAAVEAYGRGSVDKVRNKGFWAVGFVVLVAALFLLLAPQQFASLLKGDLFDGSFQVIPDYEAQQGGALFGDNEEEEGGVGTEEAKDENVVEAEAEAVSIQIEPVTTVDETESATDGDTSGSTTDSSTGDEAGTHAAAPEGGTSAEDTGAVTGSASTTTSGDTITTTSDSMNDAGSDAETITIDTETGEIVALPDDTGTVTSQGATTDADLLQTLSKQLNDYKEKERQNEQMIQQLMQMLEDQASGTGVYGSATGQTGATFLPTGTNVPLGTETASQFGTGTGTGTTAGAYGGSTGLTAGMQGVYRYNTHTVTVSPYDILAQNKAITTQPASYQANVAYGTQVYSQQTYNPVLAGVQGACLGCASCHTRLMLFPRYSLPC